MMKKKTAMTVSFVVVICSLLALLNACSENKGQDTPAPPAQGVGQTPTPGATPAAPPADGGKCATLMTAKCTECHNTARICEKLGKKSKARWQRTIERMAARGAKLSADEAAALLVCLDSGTNDLQASCR